MVMELWRRFVTAKSFFFGFGMAVENRRHIYQLLISVSRQPCGEQLALED